MRRIPNRSRTTVPRLKQMGAAVLFYTLSLSFSMGRVNRFGMWCPWISLVSSDISAAGFSEPCSWISLVSTY
ncbi:hypothetical protein DL96DRAFT_1652361 [Flagelloscypha sp. PMI_526]|nr:hypothetical protein DL96DRAFT_1652361 [Flagelloscypha sp. PMI_526]